MKYKHYPIIILLISTLGIFIITQKIVEENFEIIKPVVEKKEIPVVIEKPEVIKVVEKKPEPIQELNSTPPFTPQAPFADWSDPHFQDGCEEASALMAVYWALGKSLNPEIAQTKILAISKYQTDNFNEHRDTSTTDTLKRIINGYFNYSKAEVLKNITLQNIIDEINKNNLVIIPADGQALGNPYFTLPGPERHNLVIHGYNKKTGEFITNDPGTKRGKNYHYNQNILFNAIRDYPTGYHVKIENIIKNALIIKK